MAYSVWLWLETRYRVRIPAGLDVCYRLLYCAYTVLRTVRRHEVCSAVYGTVHYTETLC